METRPTNAYSTELDWESGLTIVICNTCHTRHIAGNGFEHTEDCAEGKSLRPRRRVTAIRRVISYYLMAEIEENGTVIIP